MSDIVVLDAQYANPGDLKWDAIEALDCRTMPWRTLYRNQQMYYR